ncbi:type III secretion protein [Lujinxingia sediminis]|uniref:Type III secretion protein n=1 Tax=Lujinxingia sediminis TaxID=2480984 RepID=A0ABY0CU96_9DELT|nr:flagellar biosynthetic protein FliR [Lujinxingia sediminis]RVU45893.1 type III secretion protein [Lujinxingia sediminis]
MSELSAFLQNTALQTMAFEAVALAALIAARLIPIVQIVPYFGGKATPQTVKLGLAIALGTLIFPTVWMQGAGTELPESSALLTVLLLKEVLVGFTLAFVASLSFEAIKVAGQLIDNNAGLTQATSLAPQIPERVSPSTNFLLQLSIVTFFTLGGHRIFLWGLARSFERLPPQTLLPAPVGEGAAMFAETADLILRLSVEAIALGVLMAFPVIAAILLVNVFLALVNKSAPQINVFFLGMPLKAAIAVAVMLLGLDVLLDLFMDRALDDLALLNALPAMTGGNP